LQRYVRYVLRMVLVTRKFWPPFLVVCMFLVACGGSDPTSTATESEVVVADSAAVADDADAGEDEDHDDEDHDDEDHDDGDHDDEDHDEDDHDDEDHDDEDHDEDHDHDDHDEDGGAAGGLDAHVHGSGELMVAWSGSDVAIDLISPADNIFGFEKEPSSDEERALVDAQTALLTQPGVLTFNDEAGCESTAEPEVEVVFEGSHAEVTASWLFVCAEADEINQLDTSALFEAFPGFEDIDAQWVSDTSQSAAELSPSSTILRLE